MKPFRAFSKTKEAKSKKGVVGKTGSITPIAPNKNAINPTAI